MATDVVNRNCSVCTNIVRNNQKGLFCDHCCNWVHLKCTMLNNNEYMQRSSDISNWFYLTCLATIFPFNNTSDDFEYECSLYAQNNLNSMQIDVMKNSVQLKLTNKIKLCDKDIDPDKHMYNQLDNSLCNYYLEDEFNDYIAKESGLIYFSVLHINARSLPKNITSLLMYLNSLNHMFSVIAVTETWGTPDNESFLHLPGYNRVLRHRCQGRGGGVAIFVLNVLSFCERNDLNSLASDNCECLFVELTDQSIGSKVVGVVYRPPDSDLNIFMNGFEALLCKINSKRTEYFLAGDYNIDLLKWESHTGTERFINSLYAHSFIPSITRPTRFSKDNCSLIDNILVNRPNNESRSGLLITDISDHLPVFHLKKKFASATLQQKIVATTYRDISNSNVLNLKFDLEKYNWSSLYSMLDVNLAYEKFITVFKLIFNKNLPLKQRKVNIKCNNHKPWISSGIAKSIRRKNYLYKQFIQKKMQFPVQNTKSIKTN